MRSASLVKKFINVHIQIVDVKSRNHTFDKIVMPPIEKGVVLIVVAPVIGFDA